MEKGVGVGCEEASAEQEKKRQQMVAAGARNGCEM